jgi:hypothetical protein
MAPRLISPADLVKIPRKLSTTFGACVTNGGRTKTSMKVKWDRFNSQRLNRM